MNRAHAAGAPSCLYRPLCHRIPPLHSVRKQLTGGSRSKPWLVYYSSLFHCCDKHCVPGTLPKEEFVWAHGPRGMSLSWRSGRRLGDWSSQLRVNVLPTSTGAERASKTREDLYSQSPPHWHTSSSTTMPLELTQTMSPTGDQVFKCWTLWGGGDIYHSSWPSGRVCPGCVKVDLVTEL